MSVRIFFLLLMLSSVSLPSAARGDTSASETVKSAIEKVRAAVGEDTLPQPALDQKLREIINPYFNFQEMSRRSLGASWSEATPEQQNEFIKLFSRQLADVYLARIRKHIGNSTLKIDKETPLPNGKVTVSTIVLYDGEKVKIEYSMAQAKDTSWQVYDVVIENFRLVSAKRDEFAAIIRKRKFEGLLADLRQKVGS